MVCMHGHLTACQALVSSTASATAVQMASLHAAALLTPAWRPQPLKGGNPSIPCGAQHKQGQIDRGHSFVKH
jgi:hypothetical protein